MSKPSIPPPSERPKSRWQADVITVQDIIAGRVPKPGSKASEEGSSNEPAVSEHSASGGEATAGIRRAEGRSISYRDIVSGRASPPSTSQEPHRICACGGKGYVPSEAGYCPCAAGAARQAEEQSWALARIWNEASVPAELVERRIAGWPGDSAVRDYLLTWVNAWQGCAGHRWY